MNTELLINIWVAQEVNRTHREMERHIRIGAEGSLALEQVRMAQYRRACDELRRAMACVLDLQERNAEIAFGVVPMPELDDLKDQLGLL